MPNLGPGAYDRKLLQSEQNYRKNTANFLVHERPKNLF